LEALASNTPTIRLGDIAEDYCGRSNVKARLSCRTLLNIPGGGIMRGHTVSVEENSLVVTVPTALPNDQVCGVFFAIAVADETFTIVGTGRVARCSGDAKHGYSVAMHFVVDDKKSRIAMEQLFGASRSNRI